MLFYKVHMLDLESFTYLTRALESSISPIVILASNRGLTHIRGASSTTPPSAHGIPPDLLARLLIIPTHQYKPSEITSIIGIRAKLENIKLSDEALARVGQAGSRVSLRYALQMLTPAGVLAKVGGREEVGVNEIEECEGLFLDAGRSARGMGEGEANGYLT
jgi:RuvB-like protein 1 (pontin 52)